MGTVTVPPPEGLQDMENYEDEKHPSYSFKTLNEFRESGFLCDVEIKVKDRVFPCHRVVLAATMPYFHSMFFSKMKETRETVIDIKDISADAFERILTFCYTSHLKFPSHSVQQLLSAGSILQVEFVCEACEEVLARNMNLENCLAIRSVGEQHNCKNLMDTVDAFTAENFMTLRKDPEFTKISYAYLTDIIKQSDLHVASEKEVFESVMEWVEMDVGQRKERLHALLSHVRLAQLNTAFLSDMVQSHPLIKDDPRCKELVSDSTSEAAAKRSRPRKSAAGVIFCVGGCDGDDILRDGEAYDWRLNRWLPIKEMDIHRNQVDLVSAEGKLYAIGGHDENDALRSAECFDPVQNVWKRVASMDTQRTGVAVGLLEGSVYAVGGSNEQTMEKYDIKAERWSFVAMMNVRREGGSVAAVGKHLFAVGGHDGTASLDSVEKYHPDLDKWTFVKQMSQRRAYFGVAVLEGLLYAIGGIDYTTGTVLSSCERYDPVSNEWTTLPQMSCPRGGVGVAAMGGQIYAVGGQEGKKYLDSVEAYDPEKSCWEPVASMNRCRAGAGVAWCQCSVDTLH